MMAAADGKGRILAGGTDLLVQMKAGTAGPRDDHRRQEDPRDGHASPRPRAAFAIGAATPAAVIGEHEELRKAWPGVVEAINLIGSKQIQGRASPGGNLCNASPAADSACPRWWRRARSSTSRGPGGKRQVPVEQFSTGPGRTSLQKGEIVVTSPCRRGRRARATPICA